MSGLEEMLGQSSAIEAVRETIRRLLGRQQAGRRPPAILLQGETGTGKGLVARSIHRMSPRARGRFVDVNCAAIPDTLIEAELFGYERGAFTDARRAKPGLFQTAHQGTIFLDEVGLLPEAMQAKLLTVIEERVVRRLGGTQPEAADAWIISATNADLPATVRARKFREDLYHRLSVLVLDLPPLRERDGDVLLLAESFLSRVCADYGQPAKSLDSSARKRLMAYAWPGNIRELSNVIERAALLTEGPIVTGDGLALGDASDGRGATASTEPPTPFGAEVASLDEAMREHLQSALDRTGWNISRTAAILRITRNTLRARIARLGLRGRPASPAQAPRRSGPASAGPSGATAGGAPEGSREAPPAKIAAVRWERRRIALMRIALVTPETGEALSVTGRALDTLIEKVRSFGGRVETLGQRGLEASFGVESVEDAPRRAVHAAMAIQRAVEREGTSEGLALKVGILATEAMVAQAGALTQIDEEARQQSGAVLDHLLAAAEPGGILLNRGAAVVLERRFEFVAVTLPGAEGGEIAYRLAGREGAGLSPGGRMAAFVGRNQEMAVLRSRLDAALRGQGQLVSIVGDAGIGKSRLLFEFRQSIAEQDVAYVEGHCLSYGNTTPYLPVLDLIRAACGIVEADTVEISAEKIRHALGTSGADAEAQTPYLLHLLGYKDGTDALEAVPPDTIKAHVSGSLRHLTLGRSHTRPLLIVVEDLHWSDRASEEMLASLINALHGARVLFVVTHRPEYESPWASRSFATRLTLPPLSDEDSLKVAQSVVAGSLPGPVASAILSKADGNPFFLEELVLALQGSATPPAEFGIPDTVQGVLTSRIAHQPPVERALLQSAAVVGKDVPLPILAAISDLPDEVLRGALRHLSAAEFLYEVADGSELKHRFRHALTHEVAYESLGRERRLLLHARILSAIERLYGDRLSEHVDRLAHHAVRGQAWDKALVYLRQAGTQAFLRSANREAVVYFEQALEALEHLPRTPDVQSQAVDLRFDLRTALLPLGEIQRGLTFLQEAETIARESGDEHRRGLIAVHMTGQIYLLGDHARALVYGQQALTITQGLDDFSLGVSTHAYLGQVYHVRGNYHDAAGAFRKNVESLAGERRFERFGLPQPPSIHSRTCLVWSLAELGQFAEGITRGEEAIDIAKTVGQPLSLTVAYSGLGHLYARMGELERAIPLLEQGLELSQVWNIPLWFPRIASALGVAYALAGRGEEATRLLGRAVEEGERMGLVAGHALVLTWLAEANDSVGDFATARGHAERAYEMARHYRERGHQAWALRLLGELAGRAYPVDSRRAQEHLEGARALGEEMMMRPLIARCRLSLARVFAGSGEGDRAAAELDAASGQFAELGMTYWRRQAEAERADG